MDTIAKAVGLIFLVFVFAFGIALLLAYPTELLLNYVFSDAAKVAVFGVVHIGFWRAFWTGFLASLLFKSTSTTSK
jgi:hypothetical protein